MELMINDSLRIDTTIPLEHVNCFQIRWAINGHASFQMEGEMQYEESVACQRGCFTGSSFKIQHKSNKQDTILFCGLIKEIEFLWNGGVTQIRLEAISASWKLDQQRISSSFQKAQMTYAELVEQIANRAGAEVISSCGKDISLLGALIQCMETDWEFLKRVASHLNRFLICDIVTGRPAFWFGMRKGNQVKIATNYSEEIQIDALPNRTSHIVHSREVYDIGDRTTWFGEPVVISQRIAKFQNKELLFTYHLMKRLT